MGQIPYDPKAKENQYPKMLYHDKKGPKTVANAEEEQRLTGNGYSTKAPSQFEQDDDDEKADDSHEEKEQGDNGELSGFPDPNADPLREPAVVSQIEQEKTRLAGNQGAKDPASVMPSKKK